MAGELAYLSRMVADDGIPSYGKLNAASTQGCNSFYQPHAESISVTHFVHKNIKIW
jgi:hypothetical protein